jgi:hypothetical protein
MDAIDKLFDTLDKFRHLPAYQLERRADIFFTLFLKEALESKLGCALREEIIPEFPFKRDGNNLSTKIDYLMLSEDGTKAYLIELKTDPSSLRDSQIRDLLKAGKRNFRSLVGDLIDVAASSNEKRKYYGLFKLLQQAKVVELTQQVDDLMTRRRLTGYTDRMNMDIIRGEDRSLEIVLILPSSSLTEKIMSDTQHAIHKVNHTLTLSDFAQSVKVQGGLFANRFAQSLEEWDNEKAGWSNRKRSHSIETLDLDHG